MNKVRITAIRQTVYQDLIKQYENPIEHACTIHQGQQWISIDGKCPDGLCPSAWESMQSFVESLARGNPNAPYDHLSLSIYLMDKDTYNDVQVDPQDTLLQTVRREAYEQSTFHRTIGWGNWLNTNTQVPTNNPIGLTL